MANTTSTIANRKGNVHKNAGLPSLAAMAVNDTKQVSGKKVTMAAVRKLCGARSGKDFTYRRTGRQAYEIKRRK